jgi:hypothetical protein
LDDGLVVLTVREKKKKARSKKKIIARYANLTSRPMRLPTGKLLNACEGMTTDI